MGAKSCTELLVWQKADQLADFVFDLTLKFPSEQRFTLSAQLQRAALSVPANIVEGFGRRLPRDKARFYNIAEASAMEVQYFLGFALKRKYVDTIGGAGQLLAEVQRMLRRRTDLTLSMAP